MAYTVTYLPHVSVALPTQFSSLRFSECGSLQLVSIWLLPGSPTNFLQMNGDGNWGLKMPMEDSFLLLKWLHHLGLLSKVGHVPHSLSYSEPNQFEGGRNGHTATHQPAGNVLYLEVELRSASHCVRLSEARHMMIIRLVQAYQSAGSQVNLYLHCPFKGNIMRSLSMKQKSSQK